MLSLIVVTSIVTSTYHFLITLALRNTALGVLGMPIMNSGLLSGNTTCDNFDYCVRATCMFNVSYYWTGSRDVCNMELDTMIARSPTVDFNVLVNVGMIVALVFVEFVSSLLYRYLEMKWALSFIVLIDIAVKTYTSFATLQVARAYPYEPTWLWDSAQPLLYTSLVIAILSTAVIAGASIYTVINTERVTHLKPINSDSDAEVTFRRDREEYNSE